MLDTEKISLLIAIPCYGGNVTSEAVSSLYKLTKHLERIGIFNELLLITNESLIPNGRATISNIFINDTNHTHLLMLDADVGYVPEDVIKLFELEVDFAVGAYPMKVLPTKYNFKISNKEFNSNHTAVSVDSIGAGFCLVTRNVFNQIADKYPELKYIPVDRSVGYSVSKNRLDNSYSYFETYIDSTTKRQVSEDYAFNNRWKSCDVNNKIWMRLDIVLTHTGNYVFEGQDFSNFK
jgi:hypothetical protein